MSIIGRVTKRFRRPTSLPTKADIIRIEMIERPELFEKGEGLFEWRYLSDKYTLDVIDLKEEIHSLGGIFADRAETIMDRVFNMRRVYLNLRTGEVSS